MGYFDTRTRTFIADTDGVAAHRLLSYVAGNKVALAADGDWPIGWALNAAAAGGQVTVKLLSANGTLSVQAGDEIEEAALCQVTADGKVVESSTVTGPLFRALNAADEDDLVELVWSGSTKAVVLGP